MTASSVQVLSSCRVQLVGLPQRTSGSSWQTTSTNSAPPSGDVDSKPRRVSRNLFGSPKPGEVNELLHKETLRTRSYMLQRYNVDILSPQLSEDFPSSSSDDLKSPTSPSKVTVSSHKTRRLPCLIAKEVIEREAQLNEKGLNLTRTTLPALDNTKTGQVRSNSTQDDATPTHTKPVTNKIYPSEIIAPSSERLKPYARQPLITECYSVRKAINLKTGDSSRTAVSIVNVPQHHKMAILEPPKSIRAVVSTNSSSATSANAVIEEDSCTLSTKTQPKPLEL